MTHKTKAQLERESAPAGLSGAANEEFLADIIEKCQQPIGVGYPDGRMGFCNRAFCDLTGYTAEELRSTDWSKALTPPEWLPGEMEALQELERTGNPVEYEKEYIRKDGVRVPIDMLVHVVKDAAGTPLYYYAFITDITERKRHECQLNERIKELTCLHELGRVLAQEGASVDAILREVVLLLPPAWQFPDDTAARITHGDGCFQAGDFPKTAPSLSAPLSLDGCQVGMVEVAYRHEHPPADEGPFLKEERALLDTYTQRLGRAVERIQAQEEVRAANQQLRATEQQLRAANQQLAAGNQQLRAAEQQLQAANQQLEAGNQQLRATEQQLRATNQELRTSEELLNETGDMARVGGWEINLDTNTVRWTRTTKAIHEVPDDYVPTLDEALDFFPDAREVLAEAVRRASEEGVPYDLEAPFVTAKGRKLCVRTVGQSEFRDGTCVRLYGTFQDITERKLAEDEIQRFQWLLDQETSAPTPKIPAYGDVLKLNTERTILDSVGKEMLEELATDALALLDTSVAVYERNGDYAYGMFVSEWCGMMDAKSRALCDTTDNCKALGCGKWLCHENCWNDSAKTAIESGEPTDIECVGGIRLYAVPIRAGGDVIGAVNLGYGNPPTDDETLVELASAFNVDVERIREAARDYKPRPPFIIELAKRRATCMAQTIGETVERNQAQSQLRIERDRAQRYLDIAPAIMISLDRDGHVTLLNETGGEILGCNPADVVGMDWFETFIPERQRDEIRAVFASLMAGEMEPVEYYENAVVTGAGDERLISWHNTLLRDDTGTITGLLSSGQDITEQKNTEMALRRSREELDEIFNMSVNLICVADIKEVKFLKVNPAFTSVLGYEEAELVNHPFSEFIHSDDIELTREATEAQLRHGNKVLDFTNRYRRKDGTWCWLEWTAQLLPERGVTFAIAHDITERRRLEARLHSSERLESIGRLAGGVAHDFNNMLMGIMNYAELCRDKIEPDHPIREWLNEITVAAERSTKLTHQLLAFARKQVIAPKVIDLSDAIGSMLKLLRRLIGEDITMQFTADPDTWAVKMDPIQIDQILANLCVNARDAIGGVGSISIETSNATFDEAYCAGHAGAIPGEYALLTVTDSGCGMDEETLKNIFEPFFTTKGEGEGTGLGLATVYGIVKQNDAFINVYSEPGEGTTFKIYLPRVAGAEVAQVAATAAKPPHGSETVLLVEDEKSVRITTNLFLNDLGYTVLVAEDPQEALVLAAEHSAKIDLLITDVIMPGMSGRDLANRLVKLRPAIKHLFISGFTADVIAQRGILDDGVNFLSKPFGRDVLAHKVREVLDSRG